ncbi:MAG TPA: ABC transporter substrate-binding protein [Chloroflexota bacterium]|nr:ABC transporter substrate-binding protein [Chloroflexota bacterium]
MPRFCRLPRSCRLLRNHCALLSIGVIIAACAQSPSSGAPPSNEDSGGHATRSPKILTIALQREPADFGGYGTSSTTAGGAQQVLPIVNDGLTYADKSTVNHPLLAAEMPSFERGTWKVFDDGTMETTWTLRSNIKWHDGTPLTVDDFQFGFVVARDKDLPKRIPPTVAAQRELAFPDAQTMVISWSALNYAGDFAGVTPLPRHILQESYDTDKQGAFVNNPYFSTEFVGLGPYKLDQWERGSEIDFSRFDDYYLGRPPLDRVIVKIIGDPQAAVAAILSGVVDIVLPTGVDLDAALDVKRRWEGSGNVVRADSTARPIEFEIQYRPDVARPVNGARVKTVRQALYEGLDRVGLNEVGSSGLGALADSWVEPTDAIRRDVESFIPKYPSDPADAARLLAQAGWAKGPDGVLVHEGDGERFDLEIWANQAIGWDKIATVAANQWKALGVEATVSTIPPALIGNRQYESGYPGLFVTNVNKEQFWAQNFAGRYDSRYIPSPANNYNAGNRGAYVNPTIDAIYDRIYVTLDPRALTTLYQQLVHEAMSDLAQMPLYWEVVPVLKLKGVKDHEGGITQTWFFYDWDKEL